MLYPLSYEGAASQGTCQRPPTGTGECRRPPTVPTPTGGARTDHASRRDLAGRRSAPVVTDSRRTTPISIAATSEHTRAPPMRGTSPNTRAGDDADRDEEPDLDEAISAEVTRMVDVPNDAGIPRYVQDRAHDGRAPATDHDATGPGPDGLRAGTFPGCPSLSGVGC
jgi:hypothetical protein